MLLRSASRSSSVIFERLLWVAGSAFVLAAAWQIARYELFQRYPQLFLSNEMHSAASITQGARDRSHPLVRLSGRLKIPRIGMNVLVLDGDEETTLDLGAAHLAGTPAPGSLGNSVIAGHRDTAFQALKQIRVGDEITWTGPDTYRYVVRKTFVVDPTATWVIEENGSAMLTLITCYPFGYIGDAPRRFIVQAELMNAK